MDLSFKDIKFMIEAVDNLMVKYQERINQIEDLDEYEDEVSDLGNDIMFLSSLRKKIDDSLNDSVSPQVNTSIFRPLSIGGRKYSKEEILKADSKQLEAIIKASTNHPTAHIKSGFDEDK
ncbi:MULTISPECIES: hypothetical protein [Aphanizomenonaceae]|uniref:Uncharacterized protein n=1 Tax=Dolichospermum heterosporum TAC447 TaxID=747523 RepID=A0ABY5M0I5_9CYAN|nr:MULTISPECIES: hypothetical protein [Aphanizomenonaceae]MBE9256178.1 hypothetical protein [Dolichospermum sp. LEGE 00246]MDK2411561.1 hypothetical protein [Aphanizomenon sp. 202]MDK2459053.1 hypothetical protein [Aphanizomenon sp. PH219]UUO16333.1 hypothetical protein NG743_04595 [Dolichospermum heterosporum TAC447]